MRLALTSGGRVTLLAKRGGSVVRLLNKALRLIQIF
jgi:hypothetical protein